MQEESSLGAKPSLPPSSAPAYGFHPSLVLKQCHQQKVSSSANAGLWQESSPVMPRVPSPLQGCAEQRTPGCGGETARGEASAPVPPCKKWDSRWRHETRVLGAGGGADAAGGELGAAQGSRTLTVRCRASLRQQGCSKGGKAAVGTGRMEREPNHKPQPRVAFSVAATPGDLPPPQLDENWKLGNNGNVITISSQADLEIQSRHSNCSQAGKSSTQHRL